MIGYELMRVEKNICGRKCFIYENCDANALLIQPIDEHDLELLDAEVEVIKGLTRTPFTLAAVLIEHWNHELSPWEAPVVFGNENFGAGAADTLSFISDALLPTLMADNKMDVYIGGYSLAGLFSLWACYNTDIFRGVAAVSPSVWFHGWMEYMNSNAILAHKVYLSLGDKEEKTRNRIMATVGQNIRNAYELLRNTDTVTRCELEWNSGNHFMESEVRTAQGVAWLLNK